MKNHYFATTKFLGFRWHKKRPTKNSKQQSKFKGQRRKLQRKVRKRGHSRISSGVENWRRPVGLLLNFPLPIVPFQSQPTLRYDFSNSILLLLRSDYLFMRLLKFERTTKRRCTLHPLFPLFEIPKTLVKLHTNSGDKKIIYYLYINFKGHLV